MATWMGHLLRVWICMMSAPAAIAGSPADGTPIEAVWKEQRLTFEYRGYSRLYSCLALQDKLQMILVRLGAHDELQLRSYACNEHRGIARFQVALQSPIEATAENIHDIITPDTAEEELAARLRGERLQTAEDVQRFPAMWKTVSFSRGRVRLDRGDCELMQQLRRQILSRMSVQIVSDRMNCVPAFSGAGALQLTVTALVALDEEQSNVP